MTYNTSQGYRIKLWQNALLERIDTTQDHKIIDPFHSVVLHGPKNGENQLLVSFERIEPTWRPKDTPFSAGREIAEYNDWCQLACFCSEPTWFRSPEFIAYFDRLIDEAFFDGYDQILFYGAGACGYAAAAFSVAAPGAHILAISPQASLAYDVAPWDPRFKPARKLDFTSRFGFAPDMVIGSASCNIVFNPDLRYDSMHAALFPNAISHKLLARHLPDGAASILYKMGILDDMMEAAMEGKLTPTLFAKMYRARRHYLPYLSHLVRISLASGQVNRARILRRYMTPLIARRQELINRQQRAGTSERV